MRALRVQEVGRDDIVRAAKSSAIKERVKNTDSPGDGLGDLLLGTTDGKRSDGVQTLVNVAKDGLRREVASAELSNTGNDDVAGVDLGESIDEELDGTVGGGAAVPVLGPLLRDVLELLCRVVILSTNDAKDGLGVGNTASTVGTVGEEPRVEGESTHRDDLGEWEVVEVGVVVLGEPSTLSIVLADGVHGNFLVGVLVRILEHLGDQTGRQVVIVSTSVVVVLTVGRYISFNSGVPVETTDTVLACT